MKIPTIKIKTTAPIAQAKDGTMCYLCREMLEFNQKLAYSFFESIVHEYLFTLQEVDERVTDETGEETVKKVLKPKIIEERGSKKYTVPYDSANELFKSVNQIIDPKTHDFVAEYDKIKLMGLIADSNGRGFYKHNGVSAQFEIWSD